MDFDPRRAPQHRAARQAGQSGEVRFTRKWFLLAAGAAAAAIAGLAALLKRDGTSLKGALTAPESVLGAFPVRSVERQPPTAEPEDWVVTVDGLVDKPLTIDHATWLSLERLDQTVDFHCVEGWSVDDVRWGGVAPSVLLDLAGVKPEATHVTFHAAGGTYKDGLPLDLVRDAQTVLADTLNDEPLPPAHGGPLRLVVPDQLGYKSVKWVKRIEVTDEQVEGYWERNGYPVDAPVG
jgi:DMSO/TMAO reductase YedYZ molybdopterin-dependent catalytic subunit